MGGSFVDGKLNTILAGQGVHSYRSERVANGFFCFVNLPFQYAFFGFVNL